MYNIYIYIYIQCHGNSRMFSSHRSRYIYNMCVFPHDLVDAAFEIMRVTRWGACLFFPKKMEISLG